MLPNKIKTIADVRKFFGYLLNGGVNFHPDEKFSSYINLITKKPTYNAAQARLLQKLMDQSFAVCKTEGKDIYEIATEVHAGWSISNGLDYPGYDKSTAPEEKTTENLTEKTIDKKLLKIKLLNDTLKGDVIKGEINTTDEFDYTIDRGPDSGRGKYFDLYINSNGNQIGKYWYATQRQAEKDIEKLENYGINLSEA